MGEDEIVEAVKRALSMAMDISDLQAEIAAETAIGAARPLIEREVLEAMMTEPLEEAFAAAYCEWQREYNPNSTEKAINAFIRIFAKSRNITLGVQGNE